MGRAKELRKDIEGLREDIPEFQRGAGEEFDEQFAFSQEALESDPFFQLLEQQRLQAREAAARQTQVGAVGRGFGRSTFTDALAAQAGTQAQQPFVQAQAGLAGTLRGQGFQAAQTGLGLDQFLFRQAEQSRQFDISSLLKQLNSETVINEQKRQRESGNFLNLLQTGLELFGFGEESK